MISCVHNFLIKVTWNGQNDHVGWCQAFTWPFRRIQDNLGFPSKNTTNNHLDEKDGRILIQLEWKALKQALNKSGEERVFDIKSALLFKDYRGKMYPNADSLETVLELNEGLAEWHAPRKISI